MPIRHNNLFDKAFSLESLHQAYLKARKGKRKTFYVSNFERNLGSNLNLIYERINSESYTPDGYRSFYVYEPKLRLINAPSFRDVVVQHAVYAVINPIFDKAFVVNSHGCRIGKGIHSASKSAQNYLRKSKHDSFTLQLDIKKFYHSICPDILINMIEKKIKDIRLLRVIKLFTINHNSDIGLPIGNLLSQVYALIYLNHLDHFIKREIKSRLYLRYVDDFVIFDLSKEDALLIKKKIEEFLANKLRLSLSKWTIAPTRKGINFVGFRTWASVKYVRKHSLHTFSKRLKQGNTDSLTSIMANALQTASFAHLCKRIKNERPELIPALPLYRSI